jgi:hypothetical protein
MNIRQMANRLNLSKAQVREFETETSTVIDNIPFEVLMLTHVVFTAHFRFLCEKPHRYIYLKSRICRDKSYEIIHVRELTEPEYALHIKQENEKDPIEFHPNSPYNPINSN